jgi:acylphosphatase
VRNEPDGSVQIEVQGEERVVEACLSALRLAMGRNIRQEQKLAMPDIADERGFVIRH